MSFILDALRKSENERQRESSAQLTRAPLAIVRHRVPGWTWLLIALLSLGLIALIVAWWQSIPTEPPPAATTRADTGANEASAIEATAAIEPEPILASPMRLRPISDLAAVAPDLPDYRLELIANNNQDPAQGSAWINGRRYFIGERIGAGPELVEVRPDSVVLAYGDSRFLLTTR